MIKKTAKTCKDMTEVRAEVDRIDRLLVALIAERQGLMSEAARIKQDRNIVHDEARIEDVVAKVKAFATEMGLSHNIAEPVWRKMISQCIAFEFEEWDRLREPAEKTG